MESVGFPFTYCMIEVSRVNEGERVKFKNASE